MIYVVPLPHEVPNVIIRDISVIGCNVLLTESHINVYILFLQGTDIDFKQANTT